MFTRSLCMFEVGTLRSVTYCSRNLSLAVRAVSTFCTNCLFLATCVLRLANCCWRVLRSRRRSSALPPNGLKATTAKARFAASNTPRIARMRTRGSFHWMAARLKFLGIVHRKSIPVQRLGLRRRHTLLLLHLAEQRRVFERLIHGNHRPGVLSAHQHIQCDLAFAAHKGSDVDHLHVGG